MGRGCMQERYAAQKIVLLKTRGGSELEFGMVWSDHPAIDGLRTSSRNNHGASNGHREFVLPQMLSRDGALLPPRIGAHTPKTPQRIAQGRSEV